MTQGIGAGGILGVALETVSGTFVAPTKFIPFESESLKFQQDTQWRRPIRNTPGLVGAVPGNVHIEGDLSLESLADCVVYFLLASRHTVTKTGTAAPYTYLFTPSPGAFPTKTLSIAIKRGDEIFGYTGCVVSSFTFNIDNGILKFSATITGADEAKVTTALSPVWPTSTPFGAGMFAIEIPTATQVFDSDNFEFQAEHNGTPQYRLRSGGKRGAMFVSFGETNTTLKVDRDFDTRADYDAFKALTAQSITLKAVNGADEINIVMGAAIKDTYEVNIGGQGDLVRASINYNGVNDASGNPYTISVKTGESLTIA